MIKKIVLLGSGNLATQLAPALVLAGAEVIQVYSRRIAHARKLARVLTCPATTKIDEIVTNADLYLFAISDGAIQAIAEQLSKALPENGRFIFAHTSGATPQLVFKGLVENYGIFYPVQTFSKDRPADFSTIPFCIDGNRKNVRNKLAMLAKTLSPKVSLITDEQRAILHVAAVFVNNFTNALFSVGKDILDEHAIPFELLTPLILETAKKVQENAPRTMQTGPARRGDQKTIQRHQTLLNNHPAFQEIYQKLSELIIQQQQQK